MFVNTRYLSPVAIDGLTTAPKGSYEYIEWWQEQKRRCVQGYSVGDIAITGRHYHYLNFFPIRRTGAGFAGKRLMLPRFLDIDHDFYHEFESALEDREDFLWFKRRQVGASYKGGQLLNYNFSFVPSSISVITAGEEKYAKNTWNMAIGGLDNAASTEFYKHREPDDATYKRASFREKVDGVDTVQGIFSELHLRVSKDAQALVGLSPTLVLFEEAGKFKHLLDAYAYIKPALESEGLKTGTALFVGTGGEDNTSVDQLEELFRKPDVYGIRSYENRWSDPEDVPLDDARRPRVAYFVPGYMFTSATDEEGNSNPEQAKEIILRRRAKVSSDKNLLLKEITQFPITPEEGFMTPDGGIFNAFKLRKAKAAIYQSIELQSKMRHGELDWVLDSQGNILDVDWREDPNGRFRITELPQKGPDGKVIKGLYVAATDSYDRDQAADPNRASDGGMRIHKLFNTLSDTDDIPVLGYANRPPTAEEFFEDTAKACVFYGWARNLIEYSNLTIGNWYLTNGFGSLLKERPAIAYSTTINSQVQNRWGVDPNIKHHCIRIAQDWVERSCHKILDPVLLDKLIRFKPDVNDDEVDAFIYSIVHAEDNARIKRSAAEPDTPFQMRRFVSKGGRMLRL
jgi:hypothetical protein